MNKEVKGKWIEALTNGKYEQGIGVLRTDKDKYCCLGVLCDLYHKETGKGKWIERSKGTVFASIPHYSFKAKEEDELPSSNVVPESGTSLPTAVENWAGTTYDIILSKLVTMNDSGESFKAISEVIEEKL